ncbi:HAD-IC family P-type ATPase, partial [Fusobacterium nucleatum]
SKAETVIFDKTGTITEGKPKVQSIEIFDNSISENEIIGLAGAAEEQSSHPLATSIMSEIKDRGIEIPKHNKIKTVVSRGVETKIGKGKEAVTIRVGSKKYMLENNIDLTLATNAERGIYSRGEIGLYVAQDEKIIGLIGVSDPPRENIKKAINRLRNYGVDDIVLLTGDLRQQAETIASRMSMDSYESELLPEDKAKNILKFQSKGSNVIMIGDGVNDAPALSYANVGVALGGTRTDVAMEAADITITQDNPLLVPGVIGLSKSTVKTIKENFAMVIGLNTFALVLGATGILAPIYASVLHNSTTILVVMNSLKLLKYDIKTN